MRSVLIDTGLGLPGLPREHRLRSLLASALAGPSRPPAGVTRAHWPEDHFGLERVGAYRQASPAQQGAILERIGRGLLEEAYFIEKLGTVFAAKMLLLARSTEERMLYGLFAADEARHLDAVSGLLGDEIPAPGGQPFLELLARLIEEGSRTTLQFAIQVVLEGWGLSHYRALAARSTTPAVTVVFEGILADEPRHHGCGLVLINEGGLLPEEEDTLAEVMSRFLEMVRAGPQNVLSAVDAELGLTRARRLEVFEELEGMAHSRARLALLHHLMQKARPAAAVVERLETRGLFSPRISKECV